MAIEINRGRTFKDEKELAKWLMKNPYFEAYVTDAEDIFAKRRAASIIGNIHLEHKLGGTWKEIIERAANRG